MGHKRKRCWACGHFPMASQGSYALCPECGATDSPLPKVGAAAFVVETDHHLGGDYGTVPSRGRPSAAAQRRAKKAREAGQPAPPTAELPNDR